MADDDPNVVPAEWFDEAGRYFGPTVQRPADMVPTEYPIPEVKAFSGLTQAEKLTVAQRYGWIEPPRAYREDVQQYVARFSTLPPGAQPAEVDRLLDVYGNRRAATMMARGSYRSYQQQAAQAGNPRQRLIWVGEDDANSCDGCLAHSGAEGTLEEIQAATGGGPGHQECGGNCRCDLMAIDEPVSLGEWLATGAAAAAVIGAIIGGE